MGQITGAFLLGAALGILALQQQSHLPAWASAALIPLLLAAAVPAYLGSSFAAQAQIQKPGLPLRWHRPGLLLALLAGGLAGWSWAAWRADIRLADHLAPAWEGRDVVVSGRVVALPALFERGQRFEFVVEEIHTPGAQLPKRLWISWYRQGSGPPHADQSNAANVLQAGQRWRFTLRLKRPHGQINPGGFDYEAWLLERGLRATGHVRPSPAPQHLAAHGFSFSGELHALRQQLRDTLQADLGNAPYAGVLIALAIGDQRAIAPELWRVFNRTGTTHLMSISGLHVTLIATLIGLCVQGLWRLARLWPKLCLYLPAQKAGLLAGWLAALAYGLLSGWGIPTQRTCFMLSVAALALLAGRQSGAGRILLLTLAAVLILDPWAVLAPGFWLSFTAVAALLWISLAAQRPASASTPRRWLGEFGRTQWAATLATLPLLLWLFQQFPLVSPLANLVAIPLISLIITPLVLLATLLAWGPGFLLLEVAHGLLWGLMQVLETLASWPLWQPPAAPFWTLLLALPGVCLLLLPRTVPGKGIGLLLLLPMLFWPAPRLAPGHLRVSVLDVGQGQAVLLETATHRLLYDAGPGWGHDDAGRRVILPYLARRGIDRLDMLVVSHRDQDHAGGLESLRAMLKVEQLFSSVPEWQDGTLCRRGQAWQWDGVHFQFLHPPPAQPLAGGNGDSCVLKVSTGVGRLLLPGDIGVAEEQQLLETALPQLAAEVLLVPHHGSTTSSSLPFVAAVGPDLALISAGYRNRFKHPRPEVLERYAGLGSQIWRTDRDGALILDFSNTGVTIQGWRQAEPRYWWGR